MASYYGNESGSRTASGQRPDYKSVEQLFPPTLLPGFNELTGNDLDVEHDPLTVRSTSPKALACRPSSTPGRDTAASSESTAPPGKAYMLAANANVAAYWAAIRKDEYAARILAELQRGLEERRELTRSGAIEKIRAAARAAREAAERA